VDAPEVMAIGAGIPIRRDGLLVGVAEVDVFLSNISSYLASLPLGKGWQVYLVESNGMLVADSSNRLPFRVVGVGECGCRSTARGSWCGLSPFGIATASTGRSW